MIVYAQHVHIIINRFVNILARLNEFDLIKVSLSIHIDFHLSIQTDLIHSFGLFSFVLTYVHPFSFFLSLHNNNMHEIS